MEKVEMILSDEQWEFEQDLARFVIEAKSFGYKLTGGELYRTEYQQEYYVRTGRSLTMDSFHRLRLAKDYNIFVKNAEGKWELTSDYNKIRPLGDFWKSLCPEKNVWGGEWKQFKDLGHFERRI